MWKSFFKDNKSDIVVTIEEEAVKEMSTEEIIEQIHSEFGCAGDELLRQASEILANSNFSREKADKLKALGFTNTEEVKIIDEKIREKQHSEETIDLVNQYRMKYPNYKFITEPMVEAICKKYGLVCGDVSAYKGFVPLHNANQIEEFLNKHKFNNIWENEGVYIDMSNYEIRSASWSSTYSHFYPKEKLSKQIEAFQSHDGGQTFYSTGYIDGKFYYVSKLRKASMKICAPVKDMIIDPRQKIEGYKIIDIPDPVVLQPIVGGYLVVTAWGAEKSDPLVVNQINN